MRKVINGRVYNTATSTFLGEAAYSNRTDFDFWSEELYKNKAGAYFLYGEGGASSKYSRRIGTNSWAGGEAITPLTEEEAKKWAEEYLDADKYEAIFGDTEEAEPSLREPLTLTLDPDIISSLREHSRETGAPMSRIVDKALAEFFNKKEGE